MQQEQLTLSLVQSSTRWHDPEANFKNCDKLVDTVSHSDFILLPEMWSTGYTMQAHKFHNSADEAVDLMQNWSKTKEAVVAGSIIVKDGDSYYNRLYVVEKGEVIQTYDKKHLFGFAGEDRIYESGNSQLFFDIKGWKVCGNICYDLRFPVWARNASNYDLLFYVANWPNPRLVAWDTLLKARAIENQAYVVGVNCCGKDAWDNEYDGHSAAYDSFGTIITDEMNGEGVTSCIITKEHLKTARDKFPFLKDRDSFTLDS